MTKAEMETEHEELMDWVDHRVEIKQAYEELGDDPPKWLYRTAEIICQAFIAKVSDEDFVHLISAVTSALYLQGYDDAKHYVKEHQE